MKYSEYKKAETTVFDTLVNFVEHRDHNGLYLIKIDMNDNFLYRAYLTLLTGRLDPKNDTFLPKYKGRYIADVNFDDLNHHSDTADGAIALDYRGRVIDDHRAARLLLPELVSSEARSGTGHSSLATASLFPFVTGYVCSAEKRTVKKFRRGKVIKLYDDDATPSVAGYDL
jgi:hypothetical protein